MAEKRMFTQKIIDSDAFLEMPLSTQALYFHLNMRADDDGFINNPKKIMRIIGACDDDLKLLILKRFLLVCDGGVLVIKHWRMHNTIQKDRYHPTDYQDELKKLYLKPNKSYTDNPESIGAIPLGEPKKPALPAVDTNCIQTVSKVDTNCIQTVIRGLEEGLEKDLDLVLEEKREKREKSESEFSTGLSTGLSTGATQTPSNDVFPSLREREKIKKEYEFVSRTYFECKISDKEYERLYMRMPPNILNAYMRKIHSSERAGHRYLKKSHYQAIVDMAVEDGRLKKEDAV